MAQNIINIGTAANDGTGDPLRTAFNEVNLNFNQVFAAGPVLSNVQIVNNTILTTNTNGNLVLAPNGIGVVQSNVNIVPNTANIRNLGSSTQRWATIYGQYLDITSANIATFSNLTISVANLHISGGSNGYVLQTDGNGNLTWTEQTGGGGNGTPGGANTQVQFNDAGVFGGAAGFTFDKTTNALSTGSVTTTGNIAGGNITASGIVSASGNVRGANINTTGAISATGNITGANITTTGSISATGNIISGNLSSSGNVTANTIIGNISAPDGNGSVLINADGIIGAAAGFNYDRPGNMLYAPAGSFAGFSDGTNGLFVGEPAFTELGSAVMAQFTGNVPNYSQVNFQNISNADTASGDYIITADNGTDSTHFLDLGMTSSNWNGLQENSLGNLIGANNGYLYVQDGNLTLATKFGATANVWTFGIDGTLSAPGVVVTTPSLYANLTAVAGARAFINDGNLVGAGNFGAQVIGGGSNTIPVWSDGVNWYIG